MTLRKPSCWSARILFSSKNLVSLVEINFSKTLVRGDNNEIGLQLFIQLCLPDLKTGLTLANFNALGK